MNWEPITFEELSIEISKGEKEMSSENFQFWNKIKFTPTKWAEHEFGNEGNGFWAVAKYSNFVLYYNDIEEGFNISEFNKEGEIKEYGAEQDELQFALIKLRKLIEYYKYEIQKAYRLLNKKEKPHSFSFSIFILSEFLFS